MRTSIEIAGLQTYAYHGFFSEEQQLGQKFSFDILAQLGPIESHQGDDLTNTVRYDRLIEQVVAVGQTARFRTLEALGEHVARRLLKQFPVIERVSVNVAKVSPPIAHHVARVGVGVSLARGELDER